jgi:hypothetical protein
MGACYLNAGLKVHAACDNSYYDIPFKRSADFIPTAELSPKISDSLLSAKADPGRPASI